MPSVVEKLPNNRRTREKAKYSAHTRKPAVTNVHSDVDEVELFLNGQSLGRRPAGEQNGFAAKFETAYQPGELEAVCYRRGQAAETDILCTAKEQVYLNISVDRETLRADGADLCYVKVSLRDENGVVNSQAVKNALAILSGERGSLHSRDQKNNFCVLQFFRL